MIESTHSGEGHDFCAFRGARRDWPPLRCILAETEVGAILVVVGDVVPNESNSVAVAEHDDVIEQLSPTATYPSLGYRVLPRALECRTTGFRFDRFHERHHSGAESRVTVASETSKPSLTNSP